jgi:hypothetical protein
MSVSELWELQHIYIALYLHVLKCKEQAKVGH